MPQAAGAVPAAEVEALRAELERLRQEAVEAEQRYIQVLGCGRKEKQGEAL